jgi:hypothetical protein
MTSLRVAITHVPGSPLRDETVAKQLDLIPDAIVITDPEREGVWPTTVRAYEAIAADPGNATHALVLQDDMLPCGSFVPNTLAAVEAVPDYAVSLFSMRKGVQDAAARGDRWVRTVDGVWGGSTVIPIGWVRPFLRWCEKIVRPSFKHDDSRLYAYIVLESLGHVWHTCPPLLQHVGASDSLLGQNNRNRIASSWDADLPVLDWTVTENPPVIGSAARLQVLDHLTAYGEAQIAARK